ncbi:PREDICTED: uncharacterized protein LOC106752316 [Dinoponera quadriceps]|uniref:Uncharacterized protein LOC106752316 n=1 Tax=Dinoponera quadriceps TaxID=609295 RepID=A0A6P3YHL5_DINQU|nr:PREDICTED: uncharacterized protein LOC106752316 [Dinoponera quadriceps]
MLRNVTKNILPWNKSVLFKRYNVPQAILDVKHKQTTTNQHMADETEDPELYRPIKYSQSKASRMRIDEYRIPYIDDIPEYQPIIVVLSISTFLIYFCILREENDIDELLYVDLDTSLKRIGKEYEKKQAMKSSSK